MRFGIIALMLGLTALLTTAAWFAFSTWFAVSDVQMSGFGILALILGVVISLAVGMGLMALVFISRRRGYDDAANGGR